MLFPVVTALLIGCYGIALELARRVCSVQRNLSALLLVETDLGRVVVRAVISA